MWYYDQYEKSSDLNAKLIPKSNGNYNMSGAIIGIVSGVPSVSVSHDWKSGTDGIVRGIASGTHQLAKSIRNETDKQVSSAVNLFKGTEATEETMSVTSDSFSEKIQSNSNMLVQYDGTTINVSIPQFSKLYISDTFGRNIRSELSKDINSCTLLGETQENPINLIQRAPNKFKYIPDYTPGMNIIGGFTLASKKFILKNLVPSEISISVSDCSVGLGVGGDSSPLFIKLEISFVFGKKPTQKDISNILMLS